MSTLSDRLRGIIRPAVAPPSVASGFSPTEPDIVPRANPADLENLLDGRWYGHCFIVERKFAPSTKYGRMRIGELAERPAGPYTGKP